MFAWRIQPRLCQKVHVCLNTQFPSDIRHTKICATFRSSLLFFTLSFFQLNFLVLNSIISNYFTFDEGSIITIYSKNRKSYIHFLLRNMSTEYIPQFETLQLHAGQEPDPTTNAR